tara:strand:+ start:237 stop:449 length:213 start_codon:yes stop_codon:yes gene_type:complete
MKTTRINTGIYKIENQGKVFQCESVQGGQWMMLLFVESNLDGIDGKYEYCNHYLTLSDCKYIIDNHISEF